MPLTRSLKGPMSKEWASMNSRVTALMVAPLSKRAQLLSSSILTWAMFSGPLKWVSGSGIKKGAFQDVPRLKEPCLGMLAEQLLVSEGPGLPSFVIPSFAFKLTFWAVLLRSFRQSHPWRLASLPHPKIPFLPTLVSYFLWRLLIMVDC